MEDHLVTALAAAIAAALMKAMAGSLWQKIRRQLASALGRGNLELSRAIETQLEESRWLLENAPEEMRAHAAEEITAEWRGTLRTLLTEHPSLIDDMRNIFGDFRIHQVATANRGSVVHQAGRDMNNHRLSNS